MSTGMLRLAIVKALDDAIINLVPLLSSGMCSPYIRTSPIRSSDSHGSQLAKPRIAFGACLGWGSVVRGDFDEQHGEYAGCGNQVRRQAVNDRPRVKLVVSEVKGTAKQLSTECIGGWDPFAGQHIRSWIKRGLLFYDADNKLALSKLVPL